ncbi:MAG: family 16 glycosylhydrolase [Deltaproteobacteria bacterium]|nr:family 16 glycosylhydrolase [Deltaproteobacteria bacterium]
MVRALYRKNTVLFLLALVWFAIACSREDATAVEEIQNESGTNPNGSGSGDGGAGAENDKDNTLGGRASLAGAGASDEGGMNGANDADAGDSGGGAGSENNHAESDASYGDGGKTIAEGGVEKPALQDYTLVVNAPSSGDMLEGSVTVSGMAPGFLNVEVWDPQHKKPPLAQATPEGDGTFTTTIDVSSLATGSTIWTVYAWDSPPGESFNHTTSVSLQVTIGTNTCSEQTCSGHGVCMVESGRAMCICEDDYHAVGLSCVSDQIEVDGQPDPGTKYVPDGYQLAFSDEFNASSLDTSTWNTLAPFGVQWYSDSDQKQAFVADAVGLSNGIATFTAQPSSRSDTNGQPYSSGGITTNGTFTHGYFEARVKVPEGKGLWPAFWLTSSERWPPEWDVFEIIDGVIYGFPHPVSEGRCEFIEGAAGPDSTYTIDNVYGIYHIYGFTWTETDLYWYVDGVLTEHYEINAAAGSNDPFWLNLSLQVGGDWPGDPDGSTPFPAHMEVDYVRVYTL